MSVMSKKIDRALHNLVKALNTHAELASDSKSSRGKLQKAAAKVRSAATVYGSTIAARRGTDSPFSDIPDPRLDEPTVVSLKAERDALRRRSETQPADEGHDAKHSAAPDSGAHQETVPL